MWWGWGGSGGGGGGGRDGEGSGGGGGGGGDGEGVVVGRKGVQVSGLYDGTETLIVPLWIAWWGGGGGAGGSPQTEALCGEGGSARGDAVVLHGHLSAWAAC